MECVTNDSSTDRQIIPDSPTFPTRTMHHCLNIEEIICMIFGKIDAKSNLAALAATCKTFRDPALRILWADIGSLGPLIRCLPGDLWEEQVYVPPRPFPSYVVKPVTILSIARKPDQATDWSRFKFYAPFIRSLDCAWVASDAMTNCLVHVEVFRALSESNLERPILPKLNCLTWRASDNRVDFWLPLFLGPHLTSLTMWFPPRTSSSHPAQAQSLISLTLPLVNLDTLHLWVCEYVVQRRRHGLTPGVSDIVCGLRDPKYICTDIPLDDGAVRRLAASSCLTLGIGNDAAEIVRIITEVAASPPFSNLQSLTVRSHDLADVIRLIELLNAEQLDELTIHCATQDNVGWMEMNIERLVNTLTARCSRTKLASIVIDESPGVYLDPSISAPRSISVLRPLFVFSNMVTMEISSCLALDLDDADIREIAIVWPRLQTLKLFSAPNDRSVRSRVTLASMVMLANHCPELWEIDLVIHVAAVDFSMLPPEGAVTPNEDITHISMGRSSIDDVVDPADVARFLSALFPKLRRVYGFSRRSNARHNVWKEVSNHLPAASTHPRVD